MGKEVKFQSNTHQGFPKWGKDISSVAGYAPCLLPLLFLSSISDFILKISQRNSSEKKSINVPKPDKIGIDNVQPRKKIKSNLHYHIDWPGKHGVGLGHKRCEIPTDFKSNIIRSFRKQPIKYIFTKTTGISLTYLFHRGYWYKTAVSPGSKGTFGSVSNEKTEKCCTCKICGTSCLPVLSMLLKYQFQLRPGKFMYM